MDYFGELLRKSRTNAGFTQKYLAEKVDIDPSSISKMEKGVFLPVRKVAVGLADTLGIFDKIRRLYFFLAAYVAGLEDMQGLTVVEVGEDEAEAEEEEEEQARASLSPSDLLAATGIFGSPSSLVGNQAQQEPSFEEQVRQIVTSFNLPYAKRMIAQQMSLEAVRIICWGLKEAE